MSLNTPFDPNSDCYNGLPARNPSELVGYMLGSSYDTVKAVRCALPMLASVQAKLEPLLLLAGHLEKAKFVEASLVGGNAMPTTIPLPAGVVASQILQSSVLVSTAGGDLFPPSALTYSWKIQSGMLVITPATVGSGAIDFTGATVRWHMTLDFVAV